MAFCDKLTERNARPALLFLIAFCYLQDMQVQESGIRHWDESVLNGRVSVTPAGYKAPCFAAYYTGAAGKAA